MMTTFPPDLSQSDEVEKILWHTLSRSITDPVCVIDQGFRLCWINQQFADDSRVGGICYQAFMGLAAPCPDCPVQRVFDTGAACVMEKWYRLANGTSKCGEIRAYPVTTGNGAVHLVVKICHDITARKKSQERQVRYLESLEQRVQELIRANTAFPSPEPQYDLTANLSPRELEVIRLVSQGLTNLEIAGLLSISPHTVKTHLINICNKIGAHDRTQAAVWAARQQLI